MNPDMATVQYGAAIRKNEDDLLSPDTKFIGYITE